MVVFTCAHCGESLQKPRVEKHYYTKCRNKYPDLCCVDCLKDFRGDEYVAHTKCMTEEERYSAKGYVPKPSQNKGERKQNTWIEMVQAVLDENKSLPNAVRSLLERVSQQPNTPRKKPKFVNFIKSMDRRVQPETIERVWSLLSAKLELLKGQPSRPKVSEEPVATNDNNEKTDEEKPTNTNENGDTANGSAEDENQLSKKERKKKKKQQKYEAESKEIETENQNGHDSPNQETLDDVKPEKTGKKRKAPKANAENGEHPIIEDEPAVKKGKKRKVSKEDAEIEIENGETITEDEPTVKKGKKDDAASFDWRNTIVAVLNAKNKPIALKKLQKKVLSEYLSANNIAEITDRALKKYEKNLKKIPNIKIVQDKAQIVNSEE